MAKKVQGIAIKEGSTSQDAVFIEARKGRQYSFISLKNHGIELILDMKLSGSEVKLLLALMELYNPPKDDQCIAFPSSGHLADRLGVTVQFIYRNLNNLIDRGIILKSSSDVGGAKVIRFANWLMY
jgi:DNA-binding MarR family transcriptional regulator